MMPCGEMITGPAQRLDALKFRQAITHEIQNARFFSHQSSALRQVSARRRQLRGRRTGGHCVAGGFQPHEVRSGLVALRDAPAAEEHEVVAIRRDVAEEPRDARVAPVLAEARQHVAEDVRLRDRAVDVGHDDADVPVEEVEEGADDLAVRLELDEVLAELQVLRHARELRRRGMRRLHLRPPA